MTGTVTIGDQKFVKVEDPAQGKKAVQVAKIIQILQNNPGEPMLFEDLCDQVGQKYPQDIQACMFALELVEHVDHYKDANEAGTRGKSYYAWTGPTDPTSASRQ